MSKDHDRLDGIFKDFQRLKSTDLSEAAKPFSEFKAGLERHIVWEEEILFPLFEAHTGMYDEGPTAVMRMEHREIKELLERIRAKIQEGDAETGELETALLEILTAHNQKEEGILYPSIDNSLNAEELQEALAKMKPPSSGRPA